MQDGQDWRDFENAVGDIFDEFGYRTERNVNFKTARRFQIDLIAYDRMRAFFVDCKDHFYISPSKEEEFIIQQNARMLNYVKQNGEFAGKRNISLLVTRYRTNSLMEHTEGIGKILAVDINSLPELLSNLHLYESELLSMKDI